MLIALAAACASAPPAQTPKVKDTFRIRVVPAFVMAGSSVRITCTVPEHYSAGWLRVAIENVQTSTHPIGAVTTSLLIDHVPCLDGGVVATCSVQTAAGDERVEHRLEMFGCPTD